MLMKSRAMQPLSDGALTQKIRRSVSHIILHIFLFGMTLIFVYENANFCLSRCPFFDENFNCLMKMLIFSMKKRKCNSPGGYTPRLLLPHQSAGGRRAQNAFELLRPSTHRHKSSPAGF